MKEIEMFEFFKDLWEKDYHEEFLRQYSSEDRQEDLKNLSLMHQLFIDFYVSSSLRILQRGEDSIKRNLDRSLLNHSQELFLNVVDVSLYISYTASDNSVYEAKSEEYEKDCKNLLTQLSNLPDKENLLIKTAIGFIYSSYGMHFRKLHLHGKAIENFEIALEIFHSVNNKSMICDLLTKLGYVYDSIFQTEKALDFHERALKIVVQNEYTRYHVRTELNIGYYYLLLGRLEEALNHELNAYDQFQLLIKKNPSMNLFLRSGEIIKENLGEIYNARGEFDKALIYFRSALELAENHENYDSIANICGEIGSIYRQEGKFDLAKEYLNRALRSWKSKQKLYYADRILFDLIRLANDTNEIKLIENYLQELAKIKQEIKEESAKKRVSQYITATEALLLKNSGRIRDKAVAQEKLIQIISEKLYFNLTAFAMIQLCEILLEEYKGFNDIKAFEEAKDIVDSLKDLGNQNNIFPLVVHVLVLQSKFSTLDGNLEATFEYLNKALLISNEKKLTLLEKKITKELSVAEYEIVRAKDLIESNMTLSKRIDEFRLSSYLSEADKIIKG